MRRVWTLGIVAVLSCAHAPRIEAPVDYTSHPGDDWFAFRAKTLGIDPEAARARDEALPVDEPPADGTLDEVTAVEAAALWRDLCARCHGPNGQGEGVELKTDPPPKRWGTMGVAMGFFFGGDAMRAGIYRSIVQGGEPQNGRPSIMPSWGRELSREQIWALVRHIESL